MKKCTFYTTLALVAGLMLFTANAGWGQEKWIDENIQAWTSRAYGNWTQTINVGESTGTVTMTDCNVSPTSTHDGNTGWVQMRATVPSILELPEVPNVSQIEFNISAFGAGRSVVLQRYDGEAWVSVATYSGIGTTVINFITDVDLDAPTIFRLTNASHPIRVHDIIIYEYLEADVDNPTSFAAIAEYDSGDHNIILSWDLNAANDDVLLAWSSDGTFGATPDTQTPGETITGGGTVLYFGDNTSYAHEDLNPNTTYHYRIWSFDGAEYSLGVTVNKTTYPDPVATTLPYLEEFADDLGDMYVYTVAGVKPWVHDAGGYALANGFQGENPENHWLILPGINMDVYDEVNMTFDTWWRFGNDDADNYLKLYYSTNYAGVGSPASASWTELPFDKPASDQEWGSSGVIDLNGIEGTSVWLAFQYYSTNAPRRWQVDNINIYEDKDFVTFYFRGPAWMDNDPHDPEV
ncbi:MAG: DUF5017 domain-containing protein, partial [Bacteroidales bacterium]|nr:DUF5017 domain-containing protein [Bacteroidales bacterium]